MVLEKLENRTDFKNQKLNKNYKRFYYLISELHGHDLSQKTLVFVNQQIELVNNTQGESLLLRQVQSSKRQILKILEKKYGIVSKGHYQRFWTIIGISIVGIPSGVALGIILNSIEFVPVGWGIAAIICFRTGRYKDGDVSKFGRRLNFRSKA